DDAWGWLGRLFALHEGFQVELERYAEAIAHPDPDKVRQFIDEVDFYGAEEPIIAAARRLQRGESVAPAQVARAAAAPPRSHYAQALQRSYSYLRSASAFFTSDMGIDELRTQLDVGVLGRDGIPV
ncbi:MAG: hypothetical protein JXA74_06160, partial [Anaerolineae bacterium]|nr:hypothetical protein [Anaerolineae bacterium]